MALLLNKNKKFERYEQLKAIDSPYRFNSVKGQASTNVLENIQQKPQTAYIYQIKLLENETDRTNAKQNGNQSNYDEKENF